MKFKGILAVILCGLTLFSVVSCSKPEEEGPVTSSPVAETTTTSDTEGPSVDKWGREVVDDTVPKDLKFDGKALNILARSDWTGNNRFRIDYYSPDYNGSPLENSVFSRNKIVCERLGIKINVVEKDGSYDGVAAYNKVIQAAFESSSHEYDIVGTYSVCGAQFATEGLFYNLLELDENHHLDLDQIWWNQSLRENLTISGKLYLTVGDMNTTMLTRMLATYFNQNMLAEKHADVNLYQVVNSGRWTMGYLTELLTDSWNDLNGNGKADDGDIYGLVTISPSEAYDSLAAGMNIEMLKRNDKGVWEFNSDTERLVDMVQKGVELYFSGNNSTHFFDMDTSVKYFATDKSLFSFITVDKSMEGIIGNMKSDYGLLPLPKYNEEQDKYYTRPQDSFNLTAVMGDIQDPELVSAALELLCAEGYKTVTPELFNVVLKFRYMRDSDSGHMLDLLREGLCMDFAYINSFNLSKAGIWYRDIMKTGKANAANNAASNLKGNSKLWTAALDNLLKAYEKLN